MIELNKVYFTYNKGTQFQINALEGVTAEIKEGEFVAILGHNGCGKSTLAKHLNALLVPTEGYVYVEGNDTRDHEKIWDIRKTCGMVFQNPDNQMVATVVEEEVAFGPENLGVPPEMIRNRITSALNAVGIGGMEKASASFLSGGQKQRLAIAGIIALHPRYIILDEATSMLDPHGRKDVLDTVMKLNREEGITVILVTHDMDEAAMAERIIVMEKGNIVLDGTPREVFGKVGEMESLGLDVPPVARLARDLRNGGIPLPEGILTADDMVSAFSALKGKD